VATAALFQDAPGLVPSGRGDRLLEHNYLA
jgi:hypothetical protein